MNKQTLRETCRLIRAELFKNGTLEAISEEIVRKISSLDFFQKAKNILIFHPKKDEVNLLGLLEHGDKNFYLPKTVGREMVVCPYKKDDILEPSGFRVQEPVCEPIKDLSVLDVVFVPALCADKNCHRLGYGMGCYDSFFQKNDIKASKVVVVPSKMCVEKICAQEHDVPCDMVITESCEIP